MHTTQVWLSFTRVLPQVIKLPCNGTATGNSGSSGGSSSNSTDACTFTIKAGITLGSVAAAYDTDVAGLEALNPSVDATTLQVDQVCCHWGCTLA